MNTYIHIITVKRRSWNFPEFLTVSVTVLKKKKTYPCEDSRGRNLVRHTTSHMTFHYFSLQLWDLSLNPGLTSSGKARSSLLLICITWLLNVMRSPIVDPLVYRTLYILGSSAFLTTHHRGTRPDLRSHTGGLGGVVVTHLPSTSEVCGSNPRL